MTKTLLKQNYTNHIALVLDASVSMRSLEHKVVEVIDALIQRLCTSSKVHDQETRVTIYTFGSRVDCALYDMDVLRAPSIKKFYSASQGSTCLIDGTIKAVQDLKQTATLYGDHSFLLFVATDGIENSSTGTPGQLRGILDSLPKEWTVAGLVPTNEARAHCIQFGFKPDNIDKWDTTVGGVEELGKRLANVSDSYMTMRSTGQRGTTSLFTLDKKGIQEAVKQGVLEKLSPKKYDIYTTPAVFPKAWLNKYEKLEIATFFEQMTNQTYHIGSCFYEWMKVDKIQPAKRIAVQDKKTKAVYLGDAARQMLNIPTNAEVRLSPNHNPAYTIFVESTSTNRVLFPNTMILHLKG